MMAQSIPRQGFTELYRPGNGQNATIDIVLVHGLFGHPKDTWTWTSTAGTSTAGTSIRTSNDVKEDWRWGRRTQTEVYWPRDLLPQVLPQVRILTWGYDVQIQQIFASASKATVFQHAETLLCDLATLRRSQLDKERPIIFIAHSLGGIVVKEALCLSRKESTFFQEIFPATRGVMFLGTPHRGSRIASLGKIAFGLSRVFFQDPNLTILRSLEVGSEGLERIGKSFSEMISTHKIFVHTFREELDTRGVMIVDSFSSTIGHPKESTSAIHANHRNMGRFSGMEDVGFKRVCGVLQRWGDFLAEKSKISSNWTDGTAKSKWNREDHLKKIDLIPREELHQACFNDLNILEARARIGNVETPFGSTYSWLFQGVVGFEDWLSGRQESPLYWIQGKPGSGKSTAMKFAMLHGETRKFLTRYHNSNWIITGFFFHDRGSDVQKSLSGCLREVLYQVIKAKPHLIRRLLKSHPNVVTFSGLGEDAAFGISWKPEELESALFSVASYEPLNLCLFIDALDEHEGNHRVLLAIINRLQTLNKDETCRLRLCLASRPESIFQQAFHRNPGFAIHEWTQSDILEYTNYRLKDIALDSEEQFLHLVEAIAEKACGVFVWVRLVADELIDGWCNGDSIHELMNTLSIIPPELEELYGRALRRSNRSDPHILMKYKHDAYVMFQLALCAREPLTLHEFFMVAQYCSRTAPTDAEHYMTLNQKLRRLHGRCFGLLEVVDTSEESVGLGGEVQFIHQTAKELFSQGKGFDVLYEGHEAMPIENGHTYLLEFLVSTVVDNRPFPIVDTRSILYHANRAENLSQKSSISYLREEFHRKSIPLQRQICTVLESVKLWDPLRNSLVGLGNHQLGFLVFSVWASLPLSVADCIQSLTQVPKRYAGIILRAAICAPKDFGIDSSTSALDILTLVLKTGMDADSVFADGETPFSTLINAEEDIMGLDSSSDIDGSKHGQVPKDADRKIDFLSTLVKFGADPNQMITGFPSNGGFAPATHIVLTESNPEVLLSALISSGADLSISDSEGFFALFYAIAWNEVECVRTLLWNGAHVCRLNSEGLCALAPNEERFGHNSLRIDFTRFENRCEMMMGLFLEVEMEHLEDCKFLESAQENKQPSGSKVQI